MLDNLNLVLQNRCRVTRDGLILVGVSGGPDSLCLMHSLRNLGYSIAVAHFDHQLRTESGQEALALQNDLASIGIPFYSSAQDVGSFAETQHLSIEAAARLCRYRYLFETARNLNAQAVAVGHTADDQVETVLMHLIRGAGLSGLKGMAYRTFLRQYDKNIPVVRPLLDNWRQETEAYCLEHGLQPFFDRSNDSLDYLRNRVRIQLIPTLEAYNPKFRDAIWRTAAALREDEAVLTLVLDQAWQSCVVSETDDLIVLDAVQLASQPPGTLRNIIRRAAQILNPEMDLSFDALDRALDFIKSDEGITQEGLSEFYRSLTLLRDLHIVQEAGTFFLVRDVASLPSGQWPQLSSGEKPQEVNFPGEMILPQDWKFSIDIRQLDRESYNRAIHNEDQFMAWLDADRLPEGLELRARREGDRFQPLGMQNGSIKLSDFMVNVKLPARARDRWPLLCSSENLIWIPGFRIADPYKINPSSKRAAICRFWKPLQAQT